MVATESYYWACIRPNIIKECSTFCFPFPDCALSHSHPSSVLLSRHSCSRRANEIRSTQQAGSTAGLGPVPVGRGREPSAPAARLLCHCSAIYRLPVVSREPQDVDCFSSMNKTWIFSWLEKLRAAWDLAFSPLIGLISWAGYWRFRHRERISDLVWENVTNMRSKCPLLWQNVTILSILLKKMIKILEICFFFFSDSILFSIFFPLKSKDKHQACLGIPALQIHCSGL